MGIINEEIDSMLIPIQSDHGEKYPDRYIDHFLEQYRIYLHVFTNSLERRQKSNEFFLGINTAVMAFLGYIESKELSADRAPIIFTLVPLIGIALCSAWYQVVLSHKKLARAKFKVIHLLEKKLPAALFETEWELLGRGKSRRKYYPLSSTEKLVPLIFIGLYILIFVANLPRELFTTFLGI